MDIERPAHLFNGLRVDGTNPENFDAEIVEMFEIIDKTLEGSLAKTLGEDKVGAA
jgi:hypothetical protein